jgi:hypothetical protein
MTRLDAFEENVKRQSINKEGKHTRDKDKERRERSSSDCLEDSTFFRNPH